MISVVIPVYNEEENLPYLARELFEVLKNLNKEYEVIFVDDGSIDNSFKVMKELKEKYPKIKIVKLRKNSGESAATIAGIKNAKGEIIITMDADLQNDPKDIPKLLENLKGNHMATGWRKERLDNISRKISSFLGNYVRNLFLKDNIHDGGCTFRAFYKSCMKDIFLFSGIHRFLPTFFKMMGYKVVEVEVNHRERKFGKAKYGVFNRLFRTFWDLIMVWRIKKRLINYEIEKIINS